jgi:hypothetical protein
MTDKHMLWWIIKAIDACRDTRVGPDTLLSPTLWNNLGAPAWVLPAIEEAYADYRRQRS